MGTIAYAGRIGGTEALLVVLAVVVLFGARRLPELARALAVSIAEFKKARKAAETTPAEPSADAPGNGEPPAPR